jgi:hypothetical protein
MYAAPTAQNIAFYKAGSNYSRGKQLDFGNQRKTNMKIIVECSLILLRSTRPASRNICYLEWMMAATGLQGQQSLCAK